MRWFVLFLAVGIAAGAVWWLYAERAPTEPASVTREGVEDPGAEDYLKLRYGTLAVSVRGPDQKPVLGAQVGWDTPQGPRLYYTDVDGRRTLTDVPLGAIQVVVHARGFVSAKRDARIEAGVPEELTFVLSPEPAGARTEGTPQR
jgi:hypothetical protein